MKEKYLFIICILYGFTATTPILSVSSRFIDDIQEFETMLTYTQKPIFVLFSASWCGACTLFKNIFTDLTENKLLKDTVTWISVNFDKAKALCTKYEVDRIPTFVYLKDGQVVRKDIGIKRGANIKEYFEKTIIETFNLEQKIVQLPRSSLKSTIAYYVTPPLQHLKNGIEWCIQKLST